MSEDEISNLELMICNLDLSVETKEKLYNQAHKIRNQLQQKENIIKEVREYINKAINEGYDYQEKDNLLFESLEILDKENKGE